MNVLNLEECELLGDSKYRAYISQVEKALKAFEYTSEWADLISALGKLNRVLQNHGRFTVIPKRVTIGKRLAQCLHPALPSGVHLKALETYDIIFKCIGTPRLAVNLFTYCAGLFPLLSYAAMSVRPQLLSLYETHFLPLGEHIKPALTGLLLGLLPGLEEGSEYFDRTNSLLEGFSRETDNTFFYTCMWECVLASVAVRMAAINFILAHFNRKQSLEDQLHFMGNNIDLMVEALCASVQDQSVLVQRSALEFILVGFQLHQSQLTKQDMVKVMTAAVKVVLRRDMSLNRRLYAWLLGTDSSGQPMQVPAPPPMENPRHQRTDSTSTSSELELGYFNTYAKQLLIHGVKNCIKEGSDYQGVTDGKPANLRPFRILISLLDKPEIGSVILEDVLVDIFRCMHRECLTLGADSVTDISGSVTSLNGPDKDKTKRDATGKSHKEEKSISSEIVKTANLLFGVFEPYFIWDFLARVFEKVCMQKCREMDDIPVGSDIENLTVIELCNLVEFLLEKLTLETYTETQTEYLPELLRQITLSLTTFCTYLTESEITASLKLCAKVLNRVLPSMTPVGGGMAGAQDMDGIPQASPFKGLRPNFHEVLDNNETEDDDAETTDGLFSESEQYLSADSEIDGLPDSPVKKPKPEVDGKRTKVVDIANIPKPKVPPKPDKLRQQKTNQQEKTSNQQEKTTTQQEKPQEKKLTKSGDGNTSYGDFMQYETEDDKHVKGWPQTAMVQSPTTTPGGSKAPQTLMQACVHSFQELFRTLVTGRVVKDPEMATILMKQLSKEKCRRGSELSNSGKGFRSPLQSPTRSPPRKLELRNVSADLREAFVCACQLLVDFSSFPQYYAGNHKTLGAAAFDNTDEDGRPVFPVWLQLLITCSCFIDNFPLQAAAVSTMLELISLTQDVVETEVKGQEEEEAEARLRSTSQGTVAVVILPSLSPQLLRYLNEETCYYKLVSLSLWEYLGEVTPGYHQRTVELMFQLHQLSPTPWICEDAIGNSMLSDRKSVKLAAYKRFAILWHLLRDKRFVGTTAKPVRTFDRSMFLMLDSLQNDTHPCRALTQTWLTHAIQRGDVARILEPILLILLHPDTARISIQHVNIHKPKCVRLQDDDQESNHSETKIYAISSEGGNVIYHVSNPGTGKHVSKKSTEELRSFALTTFSETGSSTKKTAAKVDEELHFEKVNARDLNLLVNPLGESQSAMDRVTCEGFVPPTSFFPNMENVKRLDAETCKKEGLFFDDVNDYNAEGNKQDVEVATEVVGDDQVFKEETVEDIVASILDEIIDKVVGPEEKPEEPIVLQDSLDVKDVPDVIFSTRNRLESTQSKDTMSLGPDELLNGIKISDIDSQSEMDGGVRSPNKDEIPTVHPLHTHILLYTQKYDAQRTLYALSCLKGILTTAPRLVCCAMSTSSMSNAHTPHLNHLQNLLIKHRRSVFGKNFFSTIPAEGAGAYRTSMYVELIISMCLYFIRSYYPNLMRSKLTEMELNGNKEVQILSCEILTVLLTELINLAKESGKGFSTYISDLMGRCKVQKALLHCVLASVYNSRKKNVGVELEANITEAIISFNEENMDANTNETFQIKLLKLLLVTVILEDQIGKYKNEGDATSLLPPEWEKLRVNFQPSLTAVRFTQNRPVVYQPMLLSAILSALKQQHHCHMHRHWVGMVMSGLPYLGRALSHTAGTVVNQLCRNLELLAQQYQLGDMYRGGGYQADKIPPDHVLTLLEGLTTICHYCMLDNAQQDVSIGTMLPNHMHADLSGEAATAGSGQIFSNLIHVFSPYGNSRESSPAKEVDSIPPVLEARRNLLSMLPRVLASLSVLWKAIHVSDTKHKKQGKEQPCWTMGQPRNVKQMILELLSPISIHHGVNLMGAIGVVWNDRRQRGSIKRVIPYACEDQLLLVDLVSSIKVLPADTLIQTVRQVIKQPPPTNQDKNKRKDSTSEKRTPLEVSMLQFFYAYLDRSGVGMPRDTWPSLLALLKEGQQITLPAQGQFMLLIILNEFVQKIPMFEDKKDQKELQEISQKLLEACSEVAGASLEQKTWLSRNLVVKPGSQMDVPTDVDDGATDLEAEDMVPVSLPATSTSASTTSSAAAATNSKSAGAPPEKQYRQYSVQALMLLAELTATLLDVVYRSEEKERVVPFLSSIMLNVFPYLKNHGLHNVPSYRACSQMLASLSGYQYSRKAWKKEAFDLLLDNSFFQMEHTSVGFWMVIVDNLMTHDKVTFRDLLARVSVAPSASLSLFTSREQEFEQRAQLLKRLSFTIFCSEVDQYVKAMPDIQERLSDSLRLPSVPSLQAQVFFCFRVLMLRMSPHHLTSLWPTIITELVHVLLQIEQELIPDVEESRSTMARLSNLDPAWSLGNGLSAHTNPSWLQLYLAACKLLDLALIMNTEDLPQFQLYRWAFVGDSGAADEEKYAEHAPEFVPHVVRITRVMNMRYRESGVMARVPGQPLLTMSSIRSVHDLHAFFTTIAATAQSTDSFTTHKNAAAATAAAAAVMKSKSMPELLGGATAGGDSQLPPTPLEERTQTAREFIERMVEKDFLEKMQAK